MELGDGGDPFQSESSAPDAGLVPDQRVDRRRFLARLTGAMAGAIGALLAGPSAWFLIGASQQQAQAEWIELGDISSFPLGAPTKVTRSVSRQVGFQEEDQEVSVFVITEDGVEFRGLSDRCTHLGCRVRHVPSGDEQPEGFFCPCHDGLFDIQGGVVSGPLPRPLDEFEMRVENGRLFARGT